MPAVKFTMLFQHVSNANAQVGSLSRIGGWSETWYMPGTDIAAARAKANNPAGGQFNIIFSRGQILPAGSAIIGQRYQIVDPRGPAQSDSKFFPGSAQWPADIPQAGLLVKVAGAGVGNIRTQIIRAIPDQFIALGEFAPNAAFLAALNQYLQSTTQWNFRGRDLTQLQVPIIQVTSPGVVTTTVAHGFAIGDKVRILKTQQLSGALVGGLFIVTAVGSVTSFTVFQWPFSETVSGNARKEVIIYPAVATPGGTVSRVVTRRVGRPFVAYRGRRSRRRTA